MFKDDDVKALVSHITEDTQPCYQDNGDHWSSMMCEYCFEEVHMSRDKDQDDVLKEFQHDKDCVYLIAKDMSTRINLTPHPQPHLI